MTGEPEPDDGSEHAPRRALIGLLVMLALVAAVVFLVHRLQQSAAMQDCVASGRTNCAPITVGDHR
jgi:flagellar biogenesis protein FliO